MKLPIKTWPDSALLEPCKPWQFDTDSAALEQDLIDTMLFNQALGLAANQVGLPHRVFAMHVQQNGQVMVLFNPEVVNQSQEIDLKPEGCLSFPRVRLDIPRPRTITGRWQDSDGEWQEREFSGIDAKCFLHELDHLNGVTFKSHVSDMKFALAVKKSQKGRR